MTNVLKGWNVEVNGKKIPYVSPQPFTYYKIPQQAKLKVIGSSFADSLTNCKDLLGGLDLDGYIAVIPNNG